MTATTHENLRTGKPIWAAYPVPRVSKHTLVRNVKCDVLVVGAGISGALMADLLSAEGLKVCIADRRGPFAGSTAANTALILHEIDTPLVGLIRKIGKRDAQRAWRRSFLAVHALATRTRELGIRCDLINRASLYLSGDMLGSTGLRQECEERLTAGIDAIYLSRHETRERFGIDRQSLLSCGSFETNPRALTAGYLKAAIARGAKLYAPADVTEIEPGSRVVHAHTRHGQTFICRHVVFTSGYEVPAGIKHSSYRIASTYAMATAPQPRRLWPERCMIWESSDPYLYLRTTPDGRVIVGGEDENISDSNERDALLPEKISTIQAKLRRLLPQLDTKADFRWSGFFGTTSSGLPLIGALPGMKNCWAVLGYGGNGTTYSRIAAEIVRSALTGRVDPDADLYSFAT